MEQGEQEQPAVPRRLRGGSAPTIYDIAKLAGVNPSTVSRASPGRHQRQDRGTDPRRRQGAQLPGEPDCAGAPTGRTSTLGLIVADITNPMIFGIVRGAEQAAAEALPRSSWRNRIRGARGDRDRARTPIGRRARPGDHAARR